MAYKYHLGITDYLIIAMTLLISTFIGIKFRISGGKQSTTKDYLMAGKNMSKFPVILSMIVTYVSAISMIGTPSEVYRFGLQPVISIVTRPLGMLIAAYVLIPVYFQCGVTTIYEFIDMRYGKATRIVVAFLFIFQMVMYMVPVLYAPVLALSAVTDLSIGISIIIIGSICTFYCAIGGLKGVLWTDVFQCLLMFITVILIWVCGIGDAGGVAKIYGRAKEGERLNIFNLNLDFTTRYTLWNCLFDGVVSGIAGYGASQIEVQRMLSLSDAKRAKSSLLTSAIPLCFTYMSCYFLGLILYAIYYLCDPILNKAETGLTKYDQLVPYYIINKFGSVPGLTGLCIAGIFSGSLSTYSSALNSLAAVTVVDFIQPYFPRIQFSERKSIIMAKTISVLYGFICIALCFVFLKASSLTHIATALLSIFAGPVSAVFIIGVLTQSASEKNALFGLMLGLIVTSWIGFGSLLGGYVHETLPLNKSMCVLTQNSTENSLHVLQKCFDSVNCTSDSTVPTIRNSSHIFILHKVSFSWIRTLGFVVTAFFTLFSIIVTGWNKQVISSDSKCLSPVTRLWKRKVKKSRNTDQNISCDMVMKPQSTFLNTSTVTSQNKQ